MATVYLPRDFNRFYIYELLDQVIGKDLTPIDNEIHFDFKYLSFIKPVGITVLSNLCEWLLKRGVRVFFYNYNLQTDALKFLDDSLFFERYLKKKNSPLAIPRITTIPLESVAYRDSYRWLDKTIRWLSNRLSLSVQSLVNIRVCIEEIFNNINDHSQENIGCVFAQHYPNLKEVRIAISDFGVGIPNNITSKFPSFSHGEAIQKATEQGFTTKSSPRNRGAGLDTLIYNVVNNNQGCVYIHSNHGILDCEYDNFTVSKTYRDIESYYPGTLIEIVLRTDTIENVTDIEEEFEW